MRRMKEMAAMQPGMNLYGELPDSYNLVVNTASPLVDSVRKEAHDALAATVEPLLADIAKGNADAEAARKAMQEAPAAEGSADLNRVALDDAEKAVADARAKLEAAVDAYAPSAPRASQLVDLALLANNLLRGQALSAFIARSLNLMK